MTPAPSALGFIATDLPRTLAFYRALGLDIPAEADDAPHAEAVLPGGIRLMWDSHETLRSMDPDWQPPTDPGGSLAFLCAEAAEVDAVYDDMVNAGFAGHLKPWDAVWGQRYAVLKDPDGTSVDLFAPLPSAD